MHDDGQEGKFTLNSASANSKRMHYGCTRKDIDDRQHNTCCGLGRRTVAHGFSILMIEFYY